MANYRKEFSKIYDKWVNKIYRFIFLKVSSQEVAQDLCSQTFLRGWESYKANPKIDNVSAFLYRIARNLVIDYYRQKGRMQFVSPDEVVIADESSDLVEEAAFNSDLGQVKAVLADLREDYQNVIIWRYLDDLSIPEIAKLSDKTEDAVRVSLHRALKVLKAECNKREHFAS
jgi:RNA polymerase sigma-70 factor (ECF subfamily)